MHLTSGALPRIIISRSRGKQRRDEGTIVSTRTWMDIMAWFAGDPGRPLVLIVLAQNNGASLDEMSLAGRAGLLHQQMTGEVVETALMVKHIIDLESGGFIERDAGGFRWQMTSLGVLVSRQWVAGDVEPREQGALAESEIRAWRDRIITVMDHDAQIAEEAGVDRNEWVLTQSQRLVEMHVLNRVLGEHKMPEWLNLMRAEGQQRLDTQA
jgi:hypothetical protein